ncbi:hypothetical protein Hanom_Chr12g01145041 [Helianthus anomalus]
MYIKTIHFGATWHNFNPLIATWHLLTPPLVHLGGKTSPLFIPFASLIRFCSYNTLSPTFKLKQTLILATFLSVHCLCSFTFYHSFSLKPSIFLSDLLILAFEDPFHGSFMAISVISDFFIAISWTGDY